MDIDVDVSELREWTRDLGKVQARVVPELVGITRKAAMNIKTDWRQTWSGHDYIGPLSRAVTFDMQFGTASVGAEIGPDKGLAQGPLGNIIEFGTVNNAPIPGGVPALLKEIPRYEAQIAAMLKAEMGRG